MVHLLPILHLLQLVRPFLGPREKKVAKNWMLPTLTFLLLSTQGTMANRIPV